MSDDGVKREGVRGSVVWFSECGKYRLSGKQKAFCDAYLASNFTNAVGAAREAGYRDPRGSSQRLLKTGGVREYIALMRPKLEAKALITRDYVISNLMKLVDNSRNDNAKVGALRQLGQYLGMWVERTEVTGKDGGAVAFSDASLEGLSTEDLKKVRSILAGGGKALN